MDVTDLFAQAVGEFDHTVQADGDDQWHDPTPCTEWDVHDLTNLVVNELRWVPPLLEGKTIEQVGDRFEGDLLGNDPQAAAREAGREAVEAVAQPGVTEQTVHLSFGDARGREYLSQVTSDVTIHTWDLARAIGADEALAPGLVQFVYDYLAPHADAARSAGAFGAAVEVPVYADLQSRLLAMVGRRP